MTTLIAIDAGTTGVRALAVDEDARIKAVAYRELTQYFPADGWVEHDPAEILSAVLETVADVATTMLGRGERIGAVGVTNQRETVVAWNRSSGEILHRAIVWQDRRTADRCAQLTADGVLDLVRSRTGLVLDPYFSGTKMAWLLDHAGLRALAQRGELGLGTVDTYVIWALSGGPAGGVYVTDATNASRTMLYDLNSGEWSSELGELLDVPIDTLAEIVPSCGVVANVALGPLQGVPIAGIAGDQQAALFGQCCFVPGEAKVTYGTGTFVLCNVGPTPPPPPEGLVTTVAWDLGSVGGRTFALEGSAFVSGAAIQWLRDELGFITTSAEMGPLAASVPDTNGVVFVPALAGLGSPDWDPRARGLVTGISKGVTKAHVARAVVEAIAFQLRDMVQAMGAADVSVSQLRADGGAAAMDLLLQLQADQLGIDVVRSSSLESTALGVALLAGLAVGVFDSVASVAQTWAANGTFSPELEPMWRDLAYENWRVGVAKSRQWARN